MPEFEPAPYEAMCGIDIHVNGDSHTAPRHQGSQGDWPRCDPGQAFEGGSRPVGTNPDYYLLFNRPQSRKTGRRRMLSPSSRRELDHSAASNYISPCFVDIDRFEGNGTQHQLASDASSRHQ